MRPMLVRIFEESAIGWCIMHVNEFRTVGSNTHGEKIESLVKILHIVCFESCGPYF
jgi:hypothetical protein